MVFFHGGGYFRDTGADPLYDGTALAQSGVIVVTLNYRLAQLGFLAHPALEAEDPLHSAGNYGLLDQQLALQWVQANIAAFGGDPTRVTTWGQSAGAISVCAHLVSPLFAGLFDRAIQESGSCTSLDIPLHDTPGLAVESAEHLGATFAAALNCDTATDVAACMRSKSVSDVLAAAPRNPVDGLTTIAHYLPNIDGTTIPAQPWTLIQSGHFNNTTTWLGGANHDEGLGLAEARVQIIPISTEADYEAALDGLLPGLTSQLVALYPPSVYGSPVVAYAFFITDLYNCTMRRQAQWMNTNHGKPFLYQFSRVNGLGAELGLGAFHGEEQPYIFGNFIPPYTVVATDLTISKFMMGAWTHFATVGNPNVNGQPQWTPYRTSTDNFMEVADTVSLQTGLNAQTCDTLSSFIDTLASEEEALLEQAQKN
jgi:para-nitrobenzyl esterase